MKISLKTYFLIPWFLLMPVALMAQTLVGTGRTYTTLRSAFNAINSGTLKGVVVLKITSNITETSSAVLNASGSGSASYSSVTIYPGGTYSITGNLNTPLIDLNGADNVSIDGRVNTAGSVKALTITNSSTSNTSGTSTIRFGNDATGNTVKYCTIKGSSAATTGGVLFFSTGISTGNDGNLIDNNNITNTTNVYRPVNVIFSLGTTGTNKENSENTISNNNIFDFLRAGTASYGINLGSNSTDFSITGNSFYETTSFAPSSSVEYRFINIVSATGNNFIISGNYIGGSLSLCGGNPFTKTNTRNNSFYGIYLNVGTATASSIDNNTIRNIQWSNSSNGSWTGIHIAAGAVNVGSLAGNSIGSPLGTGSIIVTSRASGSSVYGINVASTGTINIENNTVGSIIAANSNSRYASNFYGIRKLAGTGTLKIINNLIGSLTQANSIVASSISSGNAQSVSGIISAGTGNILISGNSICNLKNSYTGIISSSRTAGIYSSDGANQIIGNIVSYISSASGQTTTLIDAALIGISLSSETPDQIVNGNTISNLSCTNSSARVEMYGIYYFGSIAGDNSLSGNYIHSFGISSSDIGSDMDGLLIESCTVICANNIISLGYGVETGYMIYGISDISNAGLNNVIQYYFNTVCIGGTVTSGTTSSTYALFRYNASGTSIYKNNILYNSRSGGSSGWHYSIGINSGNTTGMTIDYNDYYVSGINGVLGDFGGIDKPTLELWIEASMQDAYSLNITPGFIAAGGIEGSDYKLTSALSGLNIPGVLTDFGSISRNSIPTMGAWEYIIRKWKGAISTDFADGRNWTNGTVPMEGENILFDEIPDRHCLLDQNRSVGDIINSQSTNKLVINGKTLSVNGTLIFSNGAQIVASASASTLVFSGSAPQLISDGVFSDDSLYNLTIDNSSGVTLNSSLTVSNTLLINSATQFTVAPERALTVSGNITNNAGNSGFVLQSDETGTASLIHNSDNVPATVNRYISGGAEAWHLLSSPVAGQSITGNWIPSGTYGNGTGYDLYAWDETSSCWVYNLNASSEVNWNTIHPQDIFSAGRGYLYSVQAVNPTKQFVGILNNGILNIPMTSNDETLLGGFNLIGNPYCSSIDWQSASGWDRSSLIQSVSGYDMWIWNNAANNYGVMNSATGMGTNGVSSYIAPMQGFFVRAETNGNLVIDNSVRVHNGASSWLKKSALNEMKIMSLTVNSETGAGFDEIQLRFGSNQTQPGAMKLFSPVSSAPSLFLPLNSENFSVLNLNDAIDNPSIPLNFKPGKDESYTIECRFNPAEFKTLILEDRRTHHFHDFVTEKAYSYKSFLSDNQQRFILHFVPVEITEERLPVEIYSYDSQIIIDLSNVIEETEVRVTDVMGRLLEQNKLSGESLHSINISFPSQVLLVWLKNKRGEECRKILFVNN